MRRLFLLSLFICCALCGILALSGEVKPSSVDYVARLDSLSFCATPDSFLLVEVSDSNAIVRWSADSTIAFFVEYRALGDSLWMRDTLTHDSLSLENLVGCTSYEVRVASVCSSDTSAYSTGFRFDTEGCGACDAMGYCMPSLSSLAPKWIESVQFGHMYNHSGFDASYGDYTGAPDTFTVGLPIPLELVPSPDSSGWLKYWRIWVDFNQDQSFDLSEIIYENATPTSDTIASNYTFSVPTNGVTRMRINMKVGTPDPGCTEVLWGEAEDYCIVVQEDSSLCFPPLAIILDTLLEMGATVSWIEEGSFLLRYKPINASEWAYDTSSVSSWTVDNLFQCTAYELEVARICGADTSGFSPPLLFTTKGCGDCTEVSYCASYGYSSLKWIDSIHIGPVNYQTGNDGGYGDYTGVPDTFATFAEYPLFLRAGSQPITSDEYWHVWIDMNQDGLFSNAELIFRTDSNPSGIIDTSFVLTSPIVGTTRMRVSLKRGSNPSSCEEGMAGEVEDYCISILDHSLFCLPPIGIEIEDVQDSIVSLSWPFNGLFLARYRHVDSTNWLYQLTQHNAVSMYTFSRCGTYEFSVAKVCSGDTSEFSSPILVTTSDCELCTTQAYCVPNGSNDMENWIAEVRFGAMENTSGDDNGYGDYTGIPDTLYTFTESPLFLKPAYNNDSTLITWRVWVDENRDGVFEDYEIVYESPYEGDSSAIDTTAVVEALFEGTTRMRIGMKTGEFLAACDSFTAGEYEDYCVYMKHPDDFCVAPQNITSLETSSGNHLVNWEGNSPFLVRWRGFDSLTWVYGTTSLQSWHTDNLDCGGYEVQVASLCGGDTSMFTESVFLFKYGCYFCDNALQYCHAYGISPEEEWIEQVNFYNRWTGLIASSQTGANGYLHSDSIAILLVGYATFTPVFDSLSLRLFPGFSDTIREEYWRVWWDADCNGEFDANELLVDTITTDTQSILVKVNYWYPEFYRYCKLRIAMGRNSPPNSCGTIEYGEVEDYCIRYDMIIDIEEELLPRIDLYPNPSTGELHIESEEAAIRAVEIWDIVGKRVFLKETLPVSKIALSLPELPNGVYEVRMRTKDHLISRKWVKQ